MHPYYSRLQMGTKALGLTLSEQQLQLLLSYQDALLLWNKAYNLTAIREANEVLVKHIFDSLSIIAHLPNGRLLDVGTGGGMPGLLVAICQPERDCVLLDSNGKKIRFLKQFIADHQLTHACAIQARIESPDTRAALGQFEVVTSRAFASLVDFVKLATPYLHSTGTIAAMKGVIPVDELSQLSDYAQQVIALTVPQLDDQRHLIKLTVR